MSAAGSPLASPARMHRRAASSSSIESDASSIFLAPFTPSESTPNGTPLQNHFARMSLAGKSSSSLLGRPSSPASSTSAISNHARPLFFRPTEEDPDEQDNGGVSTATPNIGAASLPFELLLAIFAHLPSDLPTGPRNRTTTSTLYASSLVCKKWFAPATTMLWRRVSTMADDWELKVKPLVSRVNRLLKDYRKDIVSLEIRATSASWATGALKLGGIRRALGGCLALRKLMIDVPCLKDDDLWALGASCPILDYLSIVSGSSESSRITDFGIEGIASACARLRHIKIRARGPGVTGRGLSRIAETYKSQLVTFALQWDGLHDMPQPAQPLSEPNNDALSAIIEANPNIHALHLDWPMDLEPALASIASCCRELRHFQVGNARSTESLTHILASNPHLKELGLFEPANPINPVQILAPLWSGTDQGADTEWTDGGLMNTTLTRLDLDGVSFIRFLLPVLTRLRGLEVMKLSPSRRSAFLNFSTTDEVIAKACKSLGSNLSIIRTPCNGDLVVCSIAESCPRLVELDLIDARDITDKSIVLLSKRCPNLQRVYLGASCNLTDASLTVLARSLPNLSLLALPFGNTNITNRVLMTVAEFCSSLDFLSNVPWSLGCDALIESLSKMSRLSILGICIGRQGSASPSREDQDLIKSSCKKIRQILLNG
ncbi:hypothetical protein SeMB42_g05209 [Synchytrium endobioticum]|uniref:F-box domain-containing protein n=1 Tax=Synchytrium endobioticum TaxID=286115 RepID=A0A507C894_9FUNG|nr:hypothetical protein SeLEV6574_g07944 [Synchytrium endobioticum]TPX42239.1 hypothetical protein SeMB42_g05209 [Synchytrium endobioticum]